MKDGDGSPKLKTKPELDGGKIDKKGTSGTSGTKSNNRSVKVTSSAVNPKLQSQDSPLWGTLPKQSPLVHDATDIIHLVLQKNMSLEDRKWEIQENIACMKKQLQQQQEDEELLALMKEEEELHSQLGEASTSSDGTSSKSGKMGNANKNKKCGMVKENVPSNGSHDSDLIANILADLHNLAGVNFDMSGFLNKKVVDKQELNNVMPVTDTRKSKRSKHDEESDTVSESRTSSDDNEDEVRVVKWKNPRTGKFRSGRHDKPSDTKLISNEWYAHTALNEALGGERDFSELSFNLFVAGELEIISSRQVSDKEIYSRLELLEAIGVQI